MWHQRDGCWRIFSVTRTSPLAIVRGVTLVTAQTPGATEVTVWNLEMTARPSDLIEASPVEGLVLMECIAPAPEVSKFFYQLVGGEWSWVDRLSWSDERWWSWVDRPEQHLWTCWLGGAPVGYFELESQGAGVVELAYFGLNRRFHGRGIGRWLLARAVDTAWSLPGIERLWLHTCSLDGPAALPNYERIGFTIAGESTEHRLVDSP